jgi:hypothetical protein
MGLNYVSSVSNSAARALLRPPNKIMCAQWTQQWSEYLKQLVLFLYISILIKHKRSREQLGLFFVRLFAQVIMRYRHPSLVSAVNWFQKNRTLSETALTALHRKVSVKKLKSAT